LATVPQRHGRRRCGRPGHVPRHTRRIRTFAGRAAFPDWDWHEDDAVSVVQTWPADGGFIVEVELYRRGDLTRQRTFVDEQAVIFSQQLFAEVAE
jgi:hypothetical protein